MPHHLKLTIVPKPEVGTGFGFGIGWVELDGQRLQAVQRLDIKAALDEFPEVTLTLAGVQLDVELAGLLQSANLDVVREHEPDLVSAASRLQRWLIEHYRPEERSAVPVDLVDHCEAVSRALTGLKEGRLTAAMQPDSTAPTAAETKLLYGENRYPIAAAKVGE